MAAMRVRLRTSKQGFSGRSPRHESARPGPLKVVPANAAIHIANLAAEIHSRAHARFHRVQPHFAQRHPTGGDLGKIPPPLTFDREDKGGEGVHECAPWQARKLT